MALVAAPTNDRKRVKVYELRNNDWFDRGTGFCRGVLVNNEEAKIVVASEDDASRQLLETRISKDDGYQKQQDTLIVWTEQNGTDMALSFQEPEGCGAIWEFVTEVQTRLQQLAQDDALSEDLEHMAAIMLPPPDFGKLPEIENIMRTAANNPGGRESLAKCILSQDYIAKLIPLVGMAEDLESLADLHRLCSIMKTLILLNDTAIIEYVVTDQAILPVVGALEYDPDFPLHKANHRQYLSDESRFKEVVKIEDPQIKKKIHYTYRLQYLKDVVLARILDDPTFSVLNSLIFFHQVDIVQHLQSNTAFLEELFGIFRPEEKDLQRKKDAVLLIQQCCAVAKSLQAIARGQLYQNFVRHNLLEVIQFALKHPDATVRVAGTDILVSLIDHDALLVRGYIFSAVGERTKPLTDTLIELLLNEVDIGVKSQMADAIKVLLDPVLNEQAINALHQARPNNENMAKLRDLLPPITSVEQFVQKLYDEAALKLFRPFKDLENRESMDLTFEEITLFSLLLEIVCFFIRSHGFRCKYFVISENITARVAQLMQSSDKPLQLSAVKYFRVALGLHDEYLNRQIIQQRLFDPILKILYDTMPRDNLLNSACLELFEHICREAMRSIVIHLVEAHREKLQAITYVDTFQRIILCYERFHEQPSTTQEMEASFTSADSDTPARGPHIINGGVSRWGQGLKEPDPDEENYFNTSDDEEEGLPNAVKPIANGASPIRPLVNYPDDDDADDDMDILTTADPIVNTGGATTSASTQTKPHGETLLSSLESNAEKVSEVIGLPRRISDKRRRDDDEEDELLLNITEKRRASVGSNGSPTATGPENLKGLRIRSKGKDNGGGPRKISITLGKKAAATAGSGGETDGGGE